LSRAGSDTHVSALCCACASWAGSAVMFCVCASWAGQCCHVLCLCFVGRAVLPLHRAAVVCNANETCSLNRAYKPVPIYTGHTGLCIPNSFVSLHPKIPFWMPNVQGCLKFLTIRTSGFIFPKWKKFLHLLGSTSSGQSKTRTERRLD
jgi:hypothetical protein